jgi:hypothetical protein
MLKISNDEFLIFESDESSASLLVKSGLIHLSKRYIRKLQNAKNFRYKMNLLYTRLMKAALH